MSNNPQTIRRVDKPDSNLDDAGELAVKMVVNAWHKWRRDIPGSAFHLQETLNLLNDVAEGVQEGGLMTDLNLLILIFNAREQS